MQIFPLRKVETELDLLEAIVRNHENPVPHLELKGLHKALQLCTCGVSGGLADEVLLVLALQCGVFFQRFGIFHKGNAQLKGHGAAEPIGFHIDHSFGNSMPKRKRKDKGEERKEYEQNQFVRIDFRLST